MPKISPSVPTPTSNKALISREDVKKEAPTGSYPRERDNFSDVPSGHESNQLEKGALVTPDPVRDRSKFTTRQDERGSAASMLQLTHIELELSDLQSKQCRFGRPLVIVSKPPQDVTRRQFTPAETFLEAQGADISPLSAFRDSELYLFDALSSPALRKIDAKWLLKEELGTFYEVVFDINLDSEESSQFGRQFALAALLEAGLLGISDQDMVQRLCRSVPEKFRAEGLNDALLFCRGEQGSLAAKFLLKWGASPDARTLYDDMTALHCALRREDEAMIKRLVESGADTTSSLGAYESAQDLVTEEGFMHLAHLLRRNSISSSST